MWTIIKSALAGSWLKIAQLVGIAVGVLAVYHSIRKGGADAEKLKQHERAKQADNRMARVPHATDGGTVDRLRDGKF